MRKTVEFHARTEQTFYGTKYEGPQSVRFIRDDALNAISPFRIDFGRDYGAFEVSPAQAYRHALHYRAALNGGLSCKTLEIGDGALLRAWRMPAERGRPSTAPELMMLPSTAPHLPDLRFDMDQLERVFEFVADFVNSYMHQMQFRRDRAPNWYGPAMT